MKFDEAYKNIEHVFGSEPEKILRQYIKKLSGLRPFLDLGAGQGRHALFLANHGFTVDAIDPSQVAMDLLARRAKEEKLAIRTHRCGFGTFVPDVDFFSGVGVFGLVQLLSREDISLLVDKITGWTGRGSLVFLTAFTTADSGYEQKAQSWDRIGKHSFSDGEDQVRTYLEPGEIMGLFEGFEPLYHWEGFGQSHRHGDGPYQRHAMAEAVVRRPDL